MIVRKESREKRKIESSGHMIGGGCQEDSDLKDLFCFCLRKEGE